MAHAISLGPSAAREQDSPQPPNAAASDQTKVSALAAVYAKRRHGDYPTPQQWLRSKQARNLIDAIKLDMGMGAKKKIKDVYNHPDLEYAYEAHLDPFFMLDLVRTYRCTRGVSAPRC